MNHLLCNLILYRWYRLILAGLLSLTLAGLLLPVPPALADTFTTTFTIDVTDTNPGDSRCDAFLDIFLPGDQCTLRAAVQETNALAGADIIILPANVYTLTETGSGENASATGDLDILDDLTITGAGAATTIIKGGSGWDDRLIEIRDPAKVQISDVTLRQGNGGIINLSVLTLTNSIVISNAAGAGGGISNFDRVILLNSMIMSNTATGDGGGILNTAGGQLTVLNSTISYNSSNAQGGGIVHNSGTITLTNTTISGNKANSGGGLRAYGSTKTILLDTTIVNNIADFDNDGSGSGGGVILSSVLTSTNTILAGNKKGSTTADDCGGTITSQGYNFIQTITGCSISGNTTGNITGQDPLLGPLQDNGGPTLTHAPLPGSPVIDKGNPAAPGSGGNACPAADQRGVARPIGPRCDIGAVEANISANYLPIILK